MQSLGKLIPRGPFGECAATFLIDYLLRLDSDSQAMHPTEAADPLAVLVGTQGGQILKFIIPSNLCAQSAPEKGSGWNSGAAGDF